MIFTANVMMYHGNRGLIQEGETINFSEEEIKEFEPDYFKQLFSGNEDEVAKIFNTKSKAKDKEPSTETQPPKTEQGDKNPPDENTEGDNTGNENPPDEKPKKTNKKKTDTTEE
ncbi:hypothetical protein [uncultured Streptococcus sp.]|uniref:hypothetical protein n=1 Tax=uncultured Streptococcus sp. TaxID=83427 RepID=UPI0028D0E54B|nr:hypothetical protein [uncultured Streptococcus sp.]